MGASKVKTAKKGAGRGTGAKNYFPEEDATLVDLAQKILPIGADEWEEVAILFNTRHETGRTSDSLRKRFTKLFTTKKPTGDPDCPPVVRAAKLTRRAILAKVDSASGDEEGESIGAKEWSGNECMIQYLSSLKSIYETLPRLGRHCSPCD
jgi:hypothetical protein